MRERVKEGPSPATTELKPVHKNRGATVRERSALFKYTHVIEHFPLSYSAVLAGLPGVPDPGNRGIAANLTLTVQASILTLPLSSAASRRPFQ